MEFSFEKLKNFGVKFNIGKKLLAQLKFYISLLIIFLLSLATLLISLDVSGIRITKKEIKINVKRASTTREISKQLKSYGIINYELPFRILSSIDKTDKCCKNGTHEFSSRMSYKKIFEELKKEPKTDTTKVIIPEGYEAKKIAESFCKECEKKDFSKEKFLVELKKANFDYDFIKNIKREENKLEGYLFPAVYDIEKDESERSIINRMLKKFDSVVMPLYRDYKGQTENAMSLDEIVVLASIIEKETFGDDMGKISSVFHNRLKQNMLLNSCATVMYASGIRKDVLSLEDIKIDSEYNTYACKGLPIGPIASPGEKAILAAMYPEREEYLYFRKNKKGTKHVFTKTLKEHNEV